MNILKEIKEIGVILGVIGLCMFFVFLLLGMLNPGRPFTPGDPIVDNWFHNQHPVWLMCCTLVLARIFIPVIFRKKS